MALVTDGKFDQVADAIFSSLTQFSKFPTLLVCLVLEIAAWLVIADYSLPLAFVAHGIAAFMFGAAVIIGKPNE